MHLAGNMLFLWIYGDNVEHRLGPARYLVAYLGTGVLATLSHAVLDLGSTVPMVGASGAISGVLGFYFIWFPRNRVRLWIMLFPIFMNVVYAPARLVLGMYLIVDNLLPFLVTRGAGGGGVAYGAHIGGFLGGLAYAWWSARREVGRRPEDFEPDPDPAEPAFDPDPSSVRGVRQLIAAGEHGRAAAEYFRLSAARTARLLLPGDSIGFGRWLANNGHSDAALVVYQRHLRDYPLGPVRRRGASGGRSGAALRAQPADGRLPAPRRGSGRRPASRNGGLRAAGADRDRRPAEIPDPRRALIRTVAGPPRRAAYRAVTTIRDGGGSAR